MRNKEHKKNSYKHIQGQNLSNVSQRAFSKHTASTTVTQRAQTTP